MKNNKINLILILVAIVWLLLLNSCRAVKKDQTSSSESVVVVTTDSIVTEAKTEINEALKKTETVDQTIKTVKKQVKITPVDPTRPSSATTPDGYKYDLNNAQLDITEINENTDKTTTLSESSEKNNTSTIKKTKKNKAKAEIIKNTKVVNIQKEEVSWFQLWWLYVLIALALLWCFKNPIIYFFTKKTIV